MTNRAEQTPREEIVGGMLERGIDVLSGALEALNHLLLWLAMAALVATSAILTYAVLTRYFLGTPTDWQDDVSVFLLIGVSFLCAAGVQAQRGHVGIDALSSILPASFNRVRLLVVDAISFLFCLFFSWKSWTLLIEAYQEGQTTNSTFALPLWIPYSLMACGMSLLTMQLLLQTMRAAAKKGDA